jgi:hypothetical protein
LFRPEGRNESEVLDVVPLRDRTAVPRERRFEGCAATERTRWYPKDGELCLAKTKPEETLVEVW